MHLPALQHPGFRGYLAGSFVSNVGSSVQTWALSWHIWQITHNSLLVGAMGLVRVVPLVSLTLFGGVLADHADRRRVMLLTQSGMALVSLALFCLTVGGLDTVAALYGIVVLSSVARAFDGPARQSMFARLVPRDDFPNAASLNGISWQLSDVLGPVIAGGFIYFKGVGPVTGLSLSYAFNFFTFAGVLIAVWRLPPCRPENEGDAPKSVREVLHRIAEGLRFVNRTPVVRNAMWVDFWATFLSGAAALYPAMANKILHLDARGYGLLAASSGAGALIAAAALAGRPTVQKQGRIVVLMIGSYGLFTIVFGFSNSLWTAALSLAAVGASDMISTVMRQTIRQLATPDELRGRMSATSSLFHISGPQLGDFEAGGLAELWNSWVRVGLVAPVPGERVSIVLGGGLCLFVAAHWSRAKALANYMHEGSSAKK